MHKQLLWIGANSTLASSIFDDALRQFDVTYAVSFDAGLDWLSRKVFGAIVIDTDCCSVGLDEVHRRVPGVPVIVYSRYGTNDDVISLTRHGAFYVFAGQVHPERLQSVLEQAFAKTKARFHLNGEALPWRKFLIGQSEAMAQIYEIIRLIASKRVTVLIGGETGTGKEVVAKAIHAASNRSSLPIVAVNCTALPANLIEAELFGHAKGAFTGAHASRIGRFEQAHRSTIFMDEIGDLPMESQSKLLRVLQDQEFQRVGSSETVRVDVRVIAASNVDLELAARERRFREDLYYRLNVVPIHLPPLRERREDIPLLLEHFQEKISMTEKGPPKQITDEAVDYLQSLDWPGNIRQLEHAVQMASALSGDRLLLYPSDFSARQSRSAAISPNPVRPVPPISPPISREGLDFDAAVSSFERSLLNQALAVSGGNKARAADLLRIKRTTLLAKIKTLEARADEAPIGL